MDTRAEIGAAMHRLNETRHFAGIADEHERLLRIMGNVDGQDNLLALALVAFENATDTRIV